MRLPSVEHPDRYQGLYVFDFGDWSAVGYTAEEVAALLESDRYAGGKVYKIHRAWPDGRMELRGVSPTRFNVESGMVFSRSERTAAESDFETLRTAAEAKPPPTRALLHLAKLPSEPATFVTALIYPAEYEDEMADWLAALAFEGGDLVEGGMSHVENYNSLEKTLLDRAQLLPARRLESRSRDELFAAVRNAVQR